MRRGTTMATAHGKWPTNCPVCGCVGVVTRNDDNPEHERTVWAHDPLDKLREDIRVLEAIADDVIPREDLVARRVVHGLRPNEVTEWLSRAPEDMDETCPVCGCPRIITKTGIVWMYEVIEAIREDIGTLERILAEVLSPEEFARRLDLHDPRRVRSQEWCDGTRRDESDDDD